VANLKPMCVCGNANHFQPILIYAKNIGWDGVRRGYWLNSIPDSGVHCVWLIQIQIRLYANTGQSFTCRSLLLYRNADRKEQKQRRSTNICIIAGSSNEAEPCWPTCGKAIISLKINCMHNW